ncbi:MAG: hypothetical protein EHM64_11555 [Ignavibacteriae bacterium]|nr:MAG: hypothetical protein EHM64_11555 [Ignavibacteriota bacterium]
MKTILKILAAALLMILLLFSNLCAQDYNKPITIEALNHTTNSSVISRSLGGLTLSSRNDITTMFANPAALQSLEGIQISLGGIQENNTKEQTQRWYSLDWLSMFDLFMEGKTAALRDPVIDTSKVKNPTYQDSVQRNGRDPNWSRKKNQFVPSQVFAAVPFKILGRKLSVGLGVVEYANADYYYVNKTAFNRNLDYITLPISASPEPVTADWWADTRSREGAIYGYGCAISATMSEGVSVGVSGLVISGTMNDNQIMERFGQLQFFAKDFRYVPSDSVSLVAINGTSKVRGLEWTVSAVYQTKYVLFGLSIKPPMKITRDFTTTGDSTYGSTRVVLPESKGSDNLILPLRGSIGVGISLRSNVFLNAEYDYNPYRLAEYTDNNGTVSNPWLDCSSFHVGLEYLPVDFVSVRFGYQTKSETFEQQGNQFRGDPVTCFVYSAGVGIRLLKSIQLNLGYEYANLSYEDNWNTNTNVNKDMRNSFFGSIAYTLQ